MNAGANMIRKVAAEHGPECLAVMECYVAVLRKQARENPLFEAAIVIVSEELLDAANREPVHAE